MQLRTASAPSAARSSVTIPPRPVAYTWRPSALATSATVPATRASTAQPSGLPASLRQPAAPSRWRSSPVPASRSRTTIPSPVGTYRLRPSGVIAGWRGLSAPDRSPRTPRQPSLAGELTQPGCPASWVSRPVPASRREHRHRVEAGVEVARVRADLERDRGGAEPVAVDALVRQPVRGPRVGDAAVLLGALEQLAALEVEHRDTALPARHVDEAAVGAGEDAVGLGQRAAVTALAAGLVDASARPGPLREDARHRVAVERADAAERPVPPERGRVRGPPVRAEHRVPGAGEAAAVRAAGVARVVHARRDHRAPGVLGLGGGGGERAGEREEEQAAESMHVLATGRGAGNIPGAGPTRGRASCR